MLMPVAATSAIWVRDTKGDIELLVSLVVITMSIGTLLAPTYLYYMSGLTANSIVIPRALILHQLMVGVLLPLVVGVVLNKRAAQAPAEVQPYFAFGGNVGLFMAVFLNVGTASPLLRRPDHAPDRLRRPDRARRSTSPTSCSARPSAASPGSSATTR